MQISLIHSLIAIYLNYKTYEPENWNSAVPLNSKAVDVQQQMIFRYTHFKEAVKLPTSKVSSKNV